MSILKKILLILLLFFQAFLFGQSHVIANFSFNNVTCANSAICFTDLSTSDNGPIVSWYWIWGDANISSMQNPCHYYAEPATYTILLKVTNANGDWDTITHSIIVNPTPSVTCQSNPDTLNATSNTATLSAIASGGTPMYTYTWSPSNGLSSISGSTATAIPNSSTCYTVAVKDANGCENTCSLCVIVNPTTIIEKQSNDNNILKIFPNPNQGNFTIQSNGIEKHQLEVYNLLCEKIYKCSICSETETIDISMLQAGTYLIKLTTENGKVETGRISIIH